MKMHRTTDPLLIDQARESGLGTTGTLDEPFYTADESAFASEGDADSLTAEMLYGDVAVAHDLNPTFSHEATLEAFLDGDAYLAEMAEVDGQRWAGRQDPWDGP